MYVSHRTESLRSFIAAAVLAPLLAVAMPSAALALSASSLPTIVHPPRADDAAASALPGIELSAALRDSGDSSAWPAQRVVIDSGAAGDFFGWSVGVDGHTAVVGAYDVTVGGNEQQGVAYIFTESDGIWTETAELTAADGHAFDIFGSAVAISRSMVAIGAYQSSGSRGAVYVFTGSGSHWTQKAKVTADDAAANDCLGWSVAASNGNVFAGAPFAVVDGVQVGAVYVFAATASGWGQVQKLTASDAGTGDFFGASVAADPDTVVVGADSTQIGANVTQGAAYVFDNSGAGWSEAAKLTSDDGAAFDNFARSVGVSGSTVFAGAPYATVDDNAFEGAVYVFENTGAGWLQSQKLLAGDGAANNDFGWSVAVSGDNAIVGATNFYDTDQGQVYRFAKSGGEWTQVEELVSGDGPAIDFFGWSVALSGSTALVGEPFAPVGDHTYQGAAWFYEGPADIIFADGFDALP